MVEKIRNEFPGNQWEKMTNKVLKVALAALAGTILTQEATKADTNNNLAEALKWDWYKTVKIYRYWKDWKAGELIVKEKVSDTYQPNIKVYWVWQQIEDKVYNGAGIRIDSDNFKWVAEGSSNYKKVGWVGKVDLPKKYYIKLWASWLELKDYLNTEKDVKQTAYGLALWKKIKNFYAEIGRVNYHLNENLGDAYKNYIELVKRIKTNIWQIDLLATWVNSKYSDSTKNYAKWTVQYYPTENTQIWVTYSSNNEYPEHDYKVAAWVEYRFGSDHVDPYFEWSYNPAGEHTQVTLKYDSSNLASQDISKKDEFENLTVNIKTPAPAEINPEIFKEKVKEKPQPILNTQDTNTTFEQNNNSNNYSNNNPNNQQETQEQPAVLSSVEVTKGKGILEIDQNGSIYTAILTNDTEEWTVIVTFKWNKGDETQTVSGWRGNTKTVESTKYPWHTITVKFDG